MTQLIGVIGYPLRHSLSPVIQQAALDYYKLDINYMLWETDNTELKSRINELRLPQYLGASITVPYKEHVMQLVDEIDGTASLIGSINTIVNKSGKLVGFNTDSYGFMQALETDAKYSPEGENALIIGAGGAARAVIISLIQRGVSSLYVTNRTLSRAENLMDYLIEIVNTKRYKSKITLIPWEYSELKQTAGNCNLIVNCTTMGMKHSEQEGMSPLSQEMIPENALVYDLVYNPVETPFLKSAKEAGARTLNGLPMLVYQGAAAFQLWVGREAPLKVMFAAVERSAR